MRNIRALGVIKYEICGQVSFFVHTMWEAFTQDIYIRNKITEKIFKRYIINVFLTKIKSTQKQSYHFNCN